MAENSDGGAKTAVVLVGELIKAAGESPEGRQAASEIGKTAITVTKAINNVLLPIAAVNYGIERAKNYFTEKFPSDLQDKTKNIPPDKIIEPKPLIAGPVISGLVFSHEEPCLKDMYLNLLASAMDGRNPAAAHPGYIEIIKQLDSIEAQLLRNVIESPIGLPIVELHRRAKDKSGYRVVYRHLVNNLKEVDGVVTQEPEEFERFPAIIDNWERLGLVTVDYSILLSEPNQYDWVEGRPEYRAVKEGLASSPDVTIHIQKGILVRTAWGKEFAKAVGLRVY